MCPPISRGVAPMRGLGHGVRSGDGHDPRSRGGHPPDRLPGRAGCHGAVGGRGTAPPPRDPAPAALVEQSRARRPGHARGAVAVPGPRGRARPRRRGARLGRCCTCWPVPGWFAFVASVLLLDLAIYLQHVALSRCPGLVAAASDAPRRPRDRRHHGTALPPGRDPPVHGHQARGGRGTRRPRPWPC